MIHWVSTHPIATGFIFLGVTAWALAVNWLRRDTEKEIERQDGYRTNLGRKIPPRSPSREKRGL